MRVLKAVVLFALPVLLFFNLWRYGILQEAFNFKGFSFAKDYVSTFPGFQSTYNTFVGLAELFDMPNPNFLEVLMAIFRVMWIPVEITITLLTDLIRNLIWFFGWIGNMTFIS